jgi:hypothetical protein
MHMHAFKCRQGVKLLMAKHDLPVLVEDMALIIPISVSLYSAWDLQASYKDGITGLWMSLMAHEGVMYRVN